MSLLCLRLLSKHSLGPLRSSLQVATTLHYSNDQRSFRARAALASAAFGGLIVARAKEEDEEEDEEEFENEDEALQEWTENIHGLNKAMVQTLRVEAGREAKRQREYTPVELRSITEEEINKCDELYLADFSWMLEDILLDFLKVDPDNDELMWRLARVYWDLGKQFGTTTQHTTFKQALTYIDKCLKINPDNANAHRWAAIIGNIQAHKESYQQQVIHLEKMRYHLLRAVELNPQDEVSMYLLGTWHYLLAEQSNWQRMAAKWYLGTPMPESSHAEALKHLTQAEKISQKPWKRTLLQIGKCYERLGMEDKANEYLGRVAHCTVHKLEDHHIGFEARVLMRDMEYRKTRSAPTRLFFHLLDAPWRWANLWERVTKQHYGHEEDLNYQCSH